MGDNIVVFRPATGEWIHDIGMDNIPTDRNPSVTQWKPSDFNMEFERKIVKIEGNKITIDVPIMNSIDSKYGGGEIYKYSFPGRINNIGIENLRIVSYFDNSKYDPITKEYIDEQHGWKAISIDYAEDCWVRNVTAVHFAYSAVSMGDYSRRITVDSCSNLDPVSTLAGGLRYSFDINGQQILVKNSYARGGRHDFVLGSKTLGPNVFYNCLAENANNVSEPHHRWSAGVLYDNVTIKGKQGYLQAINRNDSGTGHGWTGAQVVFWNCSAPIIIAMKPPTAQNFIFGVKERIVGDEAENAIDYAVRQVNSMARTNFIYEGLPVMGDAWIESPLAPMKIDSLYIKQLQDRMLRKTAKDIISFSFKELNPPVYGIISGNTITVDIPEGTNLRNLTAIFETTGQAVYVNGIRQISGVSVNDFTKPVVYVVYAEDNSTKQYVVTVRVKSFSSNYPQIQSTSLGNAVTKQEEKKSMEEQSRNLTSQAPLQVKSIEATMIEISVYGEKIGDKVNIGISASDFENIINTLIKDTKEGAKAIISLQPQKAKEYEISIPVQTFKETSKVDAIVINTEIAKLTVPVNILKSVETHSQNINISIKKVDNVVLSDISNTNMKVNIKDKWAVYIALNTQYNKECEKLKQNIKISIPYIPAIEDLKDIEKLTVMHIDENNKLEPICTSKYNFTEKAISFTSSVLGKFVISYNDKTFDDIKDIYWAKKEVEVLASKGIIRGKDQNNFKPNEPLKRADFILMLIRAFGFESSIKDNFSDVSKSSYYYDAVGIAKSIGLAFGRGNNLFKPEEYISREEMMLLVDRALIIAGNRNANTNITLIRKFRDFDQISPYAVESIVRLVEENIVQGSYFLIYHVDISVMVIHLFNSLLQFDKKFFYSLLQIYILPQLRFEFLALLPHSQLALFLRKELYKNHLFVYNVMSPSIPYKI